MRFIEHKNVAINLDNVYAIYKEKNAHAIYKEKSEIHFHGTSNEDCVCFVFETSQEKNDYWEKHIAPLIRTPIEEKDQPSAVPAITALL